jgi:hypothetical protein
MYNKIVWRVQQLFYGSASRALLTVGFDTPATDSLGAMRAFVDVNEPVAGPSSLGRNVGATSGRG